MKTKKTLLKEFGLSASVFNVVGNKERDCLLIYSKEFLHPVLKYNKLGYTKFYHEGFYKLAKTNLEDNKIGYYYCDDKSMVIQLK